MKLEVGKRYLTRFGDEVEIHGIGMDAVGVWVKSGQDGHEVLVGRQSIWDADGQWLPHPGHNHDLVEEVSG